MPKCQLNIFEHFISFELKFSPDSKDQTLLSTCSTVLQFYYPSFPCVHNVTKSIDEKLMKRQKIENLNAHKYNYHRMSCFALNFPCNGNTFSPDH